MRKTPLKAFAKSALKKGFDYSKKADYSSQATEGNFGNRLADFITPDINKDDTPQEKAISLATEALPWKKALKLGKVIYKGVTGE
tara:strand:- start:1349 stop:1603 length:255 start_codon:yes stop_codon:yes gene_type:complete